MTFQELANKRYSSRKYKQQQIEEDKLTKVLEVARCAPTAKKQSANSNLCTSK